jgi:GTP cyclohydrolase IA
MKKLIDIKDLEISQPGWANGISTHLQKLIDKGQYRSLTEREKQSIINKASKAYGKFLTAIGIDWENDPNSQDTPTRVAKSIVKDLHKGRYEILEDVSSFPSDGYPGIVLEKDIQVVSQCSHHAQTILGKCHIAYVPGQEGRVIGLSKLNRIVEHFSRRGAIQEQLTMAIHNAINRAVEGNNGVFVIIQATHNCVSCRGVKHMGASMITSEVSGVFADHKLTAKQEVLQLIQMNIDSFK